MSDHMPAGRYTAEQVELWCPQCHPKPKLTPMVAAQLNDQLHQWQIERQQAPLPNGGFFTVISGGGFGGSGGLK